MTPLKYLQMQLNFQLAEWKTLSKDEQATLKQWAEEEMRHLGIEIK